MVSSSSLLSTLRGKYLTARSYQRCLAHDRTAVVVGATSGIGEAMALRLARQGFRVLAVGRARPGREEELVRALVEASRQAAQGSAEVEKVVEKVPGHQFYACDAFSLEEVKRTALEIRKEHESLDALIMTQGMATMQGFTPTKEGNDEKLTLHYYSRMAYIQSLLPALEKSDMPAVVLSVLSGGVHSSYKHLEDDPSLEKNYSIKNAADAAGYYNDLGLDHLAKSYPSLSFVHAAPGFVNTNWGTEFHPMLRSLVRFIQPLGRKASDCAELLLGATIFPQEAGEKLPGRPEKQGVYILGDKGQAWSLTKEHCEEHREMLWKHTKEVLRKAGIT